MGGKRAVVLRSNSRDGFVVAVVGYNLKLETGNSVLGASRSDRGERTGNTDVEGEGE